MYIQATGQPKVNIYPESDSKFYLKVVDARIEFERNASNQVERLVLYQNGAVMPGKKVK
jgi:serine-type D-Ala-D-Ala carboxypeptidase/endopeptidase